MFPGIFLKKKKKKFIIIDNPMSETWMSSFSQRIKPFCLSTNHDIEKIFQEAKRRLELTSG